MNSNKYHKNIFIRILLFYKKNNINTSFSEERLNSQPLVGMRVDETKKRLNNLVKRHDMFLEKKNANKRIKLENDTL